MKFRRLFGLLIGLFPWVSNAEVFVYQGPSRAAYDVQADTETTIPPRSSAIIVVDFQNGLWRRFHFYREAGKKKFTASNSDSTARVGTAILPSGKSATVFTYANATSDVTFAFNHQVTFQGNNTVVTTRTDPGVVTVTGPRTATMNIRDNTISGGTAKFVQRNYTLSLSAARTIKANNADLTIGAVMDALVAEFEGKGWVRDTE
jgi:hypothetical protein